MSVQNIAVKLCGVLQGQTDEEVTAREWRLLGQEEDGSQVLSWVSTKDDTEVLNIGVYTNKNKSLVILHTFEEKLNIIQASVNASHSLLVYSVKRLPTEDSDIKEPLYCPYLICLLPDKDRTPQEIEEGSTKQIMVQYVYGKSNKYSPGIRNDRFLLFKHLEYIKVYRSPLFLNEREDGSERWGFDGVYPEPETVVKVFSWAQWDATNQVLYYIHYRAPAQSFAEEEVKSPCDVSPTLSALQFHADLPHETVLNIPLSLPHLHASSSACGAYEDDPVPLRIHDCSLDLSIACLAKGVLCVMHHYLYKPLDDSTTSLVLEDSVDLKDSGVNFAYSVTVLQHGCVIHSVLPDLPWSLAKALRPSHILYNDDHLLVHIPNLFTHLIDISPDHAPCNHVVLPCDEAGGALAPLLGWGPHAMVDLSTLDVVTLGISEKDLVSAFKTTAAENKIAIVHYLVGHEGNADLAEELISWLCLNQRPKDGDVFVRVMQEYLVASAFSLTRRSLPASAVPLLGYLPSVLHTALHDVKVRDVCVSVSQEQLWCGASVVLAPRQRVCQFSEDAWTRLWRRLSAPAPVRADPTAVAKRLAMTMHCYQPEALSRGSTPLSPLAPGGGLGALSGLPAPRRSSVANHDALPFVELDVCTASRQEHVTAAVSVLPVQHLSPLAPGGGLGALSGLPAPRRSSVANHDALPFVELDVCTASRQEHVTAAVSVLPVQHLSPLAPGGGLGALSGLPAPRRSSVANHDALPFVELDVCTASRQEHVTAAVSVLPVQHLSPLAPGGGLGALSGLPAPRRSSVANHDALPFVELDVCTASRQEHVTAAVSVLPVQHLSPLAPGGGLGALSGLPAPRRSSVANHDALPFVELDVCTASRQEHVTAAVSVLPVQHLSPLAPGGGLGALSGLPAPRRSSVANHDALPFVELDVCTASRQEHVTAANLRAISAHLLREAAATAGADGVHAASTRYVAAQLDAARALCRAVCRALGATTQQKGFALIEEMEATHALIVFKALEQYYLACVRVSFPLPAGFSSWFARLAYRALPFPSLAGLVHRGVLEMQIDVMKDIIATKDTDERTVNNKLRLIQLIGEGRARRTLAAWPHRAALVLRAREHAAALLSGAGAPAHPRERRPKPHDHGIAALPSGERLSPLDTFLDLLTAKASLNELDFNLIIEATLALVQQDAAN
ncbi:protein pigeon isoform X2 [Leguminivora glycinivorella]|uniref:protein pigeon isoform X2 n=1 Tax=Leguminivora glycinivorella TaxID=1035111 RepID=UPI00200C8DA3|nr:protein pigeon isoform X2 [Leguminivora glycinivorella]